MKLISRTLGDICDEVRGTIRTGPFGSQLHESDYLEQGTPVIMPKNIVDGKISVEDIARIGDDDTRRLSQHKLHVGDIIYGRRGDIGRRGLITKKEEGWICGTGCLRISLGHRVLDPTFLYYYLGDPKVVAWVANQAIGATLPNLNTSIIRSIQVKYPHLSAQRKIASILSAYDDLLENNTRRIAILEELAQSLYSEWFVHFRYPGHKKHRMVESEMGMIPEDWNVVKLDSALTLQRGFDLPTAQREKGNIPVYASTGRAGTHNQAKVKGPGVLTGRSGSLGTVTYVKEDFWPLNTTLWVKHFHSVTPIYAFYLLRSLDLAGLNSGAAVPTLDRNNVHRLLIILPPYEIIKQFDSYVSAIFELKIKLSKKNESLRGTRNMLLPKLISGKIDVETLDITVPDIIEPEEQQDSAIIANPEPINATQLALPLF
ncbi:restriction endonuclease subunit S [Ktedonobacter robiniae]|uniref:Specificity protein S n=1 Tax=Ktedonobacter robiniae TaxID=2778365 RepID=A0ABQ3UTE6_9CHLR|nr:restriction endonuclease subunit S [Ktedonobacter robiniae]GHO56068.1 specificity protein S [Ktedonobacter robiniae]